MLANAYDAPLGIKSYKQTFSPQNKQAKGPYSCLRNSRIHKKLAKSTPLCKQPRKESCSQG